jgi:cytochrome c-type biogenesis protein CcmH/NrfG
MWFFGWMFWVVPLLIFAAVMRRRRWERWAMMGPRGYGPYGWWGPWQQPRWRESQTAAPRADQDQQQAYIDSLETRIAQLEERLDFTERLLEGRREPPK